MALLNFGSKDTADVEISPQVESFLKDYSIEVMPRTAEKIADFRELLPAATRVYIAHIEGTPIEDMVATAKRIAGRRVYRHAAFPRADHQRRSHAAQLDRHVPGRSWR
jgi:hypothetical protein